MLKRIVAVLLFIFGIVAFGEVPHSYIWENPDREVTQVETLKRHKEKAELNITVTKLKSESIPMKHSVDEKKIYFELTSNEVKRADGSIRLEPTDRIFVSEKLEEVPSVSTTNGRKKINGLKKLNKSLDKGMIKSGNLTWIVKDLRTAETKKVVEINYETFPKSLYVGITDKDYNLKKIFRGKMEDLVLYNVDDLAGYVSTYSEEPYVTKGYEEDISDLVIWTKEGDIASFVDIKFMEGSIAPISNITPEGQELIKKKPYLKVKGSGTTKEVTLTKTDDPSKTIKGTIHLVNRSENSALAMTRTANLKDKAETVLNFTKDATEELKVSVYIRFTATDFKALAEGNYTVQSGVGLVYGHNNGESAIQNLPNLKVASATIGEAKKITVDLWLFKDDFADKVNYVLDPRNNGTGNLKIRTQDENTYVTNAVSAGATDSVFDMQGRMAKFDYDDKYTKIAVTKISSEVTEGEQNQGSYDIYKNRWSEVNIPGYKVRARIWSDYDGLELDFEKVGKQDTTNEGAYSFKITQTDTRYSKIIQEITVNIYVNNLRIQDRVGFKTHRHAQNEFPAEDNPNDSYLNGFYTEPTKNGEHAKTYPTNFPYLDKQETPIQVEMVTKAGDLKEYFPIYTSNGITMRTTDAPGFGVKRYKNEVTLSEKKQYISDKVLFGTRQNDYYISKLVEGKNGLYRITSVQSFQTPKSLVVNHSNNADPNNKKFWAYMYYNVEPLYFEYGAGKRKIPTTFEIKIVNWNNREKYINETKNTTIQGIPLIINSNKDGKHIYYGNEVFVSKSEFTTTSDNLGWLQNGFDDILWDYYSLEFEGVKITSGLDGWIDSQKKEELDSKEKDFYKEQGRFAFMTRPQTAKGFFNVGVGVKDWHLSSRDYTVTLISKTWNKLPSNDPGYEHHTYNNNITVKAFDSTFMWDKSQSSIKEDVLFYLDLNIDSGYVPTKQVIDVGEVYFKYLNIKALRTNTDKKAKFVLPDSATLVAKGSVTNNNIPVNLSFSPSEIKTTYDMEDKAENYAGGNGSKVYMHIDIESYKKIIANGAGQEYQVKGTYNANSINSNQVSNTEGVIQIGVVATKSPVNGTRNEYFFKPVTDNMILQTIETHPVIYTIKYKADSPLITGHDIALINDKIEYVSGSLPSGYDYNNGITLSGNVTPYDYSIKAHKYQIIDGNGSIRNGQIGTAGSGAYWENLAIGSEHVKIQHKRDAGDTIVGGEQHETRKITFFTLQDYNYEKTKGKIVEKHYKPYSKNVNQYYEINIDIPEFDPYVYYDETKTINGGLSPIKKQASLTVNREEGVRIYPLGTVSTQGYDVEITKKSKGNLQDTNGLRIVPNNKNSNNGVTLYEVNADGNKGNPHSTKGRIIFINESGTEIPYNINSPTEMVGKDKSIRVALEIPSNLDPDKAYIIEGDSTGNILDKTKDIPDNFNLIIGRNKYFKELIKEIKITKEKPEGSSTLTFNDFYTAKQLIKFKGTTLDAQDVIDFEEQISGATLSDKVGIGFVKLENGDKLQVVVNSQTTEVDIPSSLSVDRKEIALDNQNNKLALKIEDGKIQLGLNYWKPGTTHTAVFKVVRASKEITIHTMKIVVPTSQFIVTHREDLDFGTVIAGAKNCYAEARLEIENTLDNIVAGFQIDDTSPTLTKVGDSAKTLDVREINGAVFPKEEKRYDIIVNGFLDVPESTEAGEYKGSVTITLQIQ